MKAKLSVLILLPAILIFVAGSHAFDIGLFPDISRLDPIFKFYSIPEKRAWKFYDTNDDGRWDCALGFDTDPESEIAEGDAIVLEAQMPTHYWLDLNTDGYVASHEILVDALRDGLNGNETPYGTRV